MIRLTILRYSPDIYPRRYGPKKFKAGIDAGIDATGPYSWKPVKKLPRIEQASLPEQGSVQQVTV